MPGALRAARRLTYLKANPIQGNADRLRARKVAVELHSGSGERDRRTPRARCFFIRGPRRDAGQRLKRLKTRNDGFGSKLYLNSPADGQKLQLVGASGAGSRHRNQ